ncbi:carbohydrate phosphatase [Zopfia rhizophila CBS 207.26]|uniref:Carbohydrate phosphatase n=1 Tax=Zopfia rhizophila CBS 207.26 TaxID=1314779 RepID=A0A6A6DN59_9PEZI|nr:carbohydrate phosphatase [Zopfia rhizophila CBS 207.26]
MYEKELRIAELTVQRAAIITKKIIASFGDNGVHTMEKGDETPVTIGDFAAQASMITALHAAFPDDMFLAEETTSMLRKDQTLAEKVWLFVSAAGAGDDRSQDELATPQSIEEMLDAIDLGQGQGGRNDRIWCLDPIDGTATFMKGQQYAVCLCLVEKGEQKVACLGMPHLSLGVLPISESCVSSTYGYLASAIKGQGAHLRRISPTGLKPLEPVKVRERPTDLSKLRNVEALASKNMDHEKNCLVEGRLGLTWPSVDIWSQQMKYISIAVGGHDLMVRIPIKSSHRTAIWDHAGGSLLVQETGCKHTDLRGRDLDFRAGKRLYNNFGDVVAPAAVHDQVLRIVQEVAQIDPTKPL